MGRFRSNMVILLVEINVNNGKFSTQIFHAGLIDEMFGIQQSSVRLPAEKFSQQQQTAISGAENSAGSKQIVFSSAEEMYAEIRGLNFNAVGPTLSRKVRLCSPLPSHRHCRGSAIFFCDPDPAPTSYLIGVRIRVIF